MMIMMKQEPTTLPPIACGNCGVDERRLLHHVRHRGIFRRLCTSCVLRLHPQSFCPTCFLVYDRSPPSNETVNCFKCYSSSHSHCVGSNVANPYVCPPCTNPNVPIFSIKKAKDGEGEGVDGNCRVIDKKTARVFLAAASIAAVSMTKAEVAARAEAERRAKEAAFTRKRAREALEHVAFLMAKEKLKHKELSVGASGSGNVVIQGNTRKGGTTNSVGVAAGAAAAAVQNRIGNQHGEDGVDGALEVLASLNAVELREREISHGFRAQNAGSGPPNNGVPMGMEDNERLRVNPVPRAGAPYVQNHGTGNETEMCGNLGHLENHNAQENGIFSDSPIGGDQLQHIPNSHGREEDLGSQQ
ncbi:hypothetical protein F0562_029168 [Nyssa sinensis]|uniref:Uncharacterized protein n=1 Tax=Nyssa sinensis TaxID=561372 RepID=A0A5J5B2A0_9ASTE|nr:hypothetical protein F0562_029168 [Nyssa sinensis]